VGVGGYFSYLSILSILANPCWIKLHSFWTVGLGEHLEVLSQIADSVSVGGVKKGEYKNPKSIAQMVEHYAEIAKHA
jgi:hypothetical protein